MTHTCARRARRLIVLAIGLLVAASAGAQTADQIITRADGIFTLDRVWSRSVMTITRNAREQTPQEMESYTLNDGDTVMSLAVFTSPARVRGTAYLTIGDDLWVRFASTGRVRKLSSSARSNSAAGSDFSYSDMGEGSSSFTDQYTPTLEGRTTIDGTECYQISLEPTSRNAAYDGMTAYITTGDYRYVRIEYFERNVLIKTMDLSDYRDVGDVSYPYLITMTSHEQDSVTSIQTLEMEINSSRVQDTMFSVQYLDTIR